MMIKTKFAAKSYYVMFLLIIGATSLLIAVDESQVRAKRRAGESEAAYQARERAVRRSSRSQPGLLINKQPSETDTAYQERLQVTIKGLLYLRDPEDPRMRKGERQELFHARLRYTEQNRLTRYNHLMAQPSEDRDAYQARLKNWIDFESSAEFKRELGESASGYQKRFMTAVRKKLDEARSQKDI